MRGSEFGEVLSAYPVEPGESPVRRMPRLLSGCAVQAGEWTPVEHQQVKEKYIFLVRHAQSTWNREVDLMKTVRHQKFPEISVKDVLSSAAHIATREVWHRDHPISDEGVLQSQQLREKIRQARCDGPECFHVDDEDMRPSGEETRIRRFYQHFLEPTQSIYCSPLLRALQTAHFALSDQDGWGSIKLLKEAREHFNFIFQRDCLGTEIGSNLVDRAVTMSKSLLSVDETDQLEGRVDASDCEEKWWSDDPETEADVDRRLQELWRRLLEEDAQDSCILVTHSNLIKALLMRFGGVEHSLLALRAEEVACDVASPSTVASEEEDGYHCLSSDHVESGASWQVVDSGPHDLQRLKVERLQNCGVLGLRCVLEAPLEDGLEEWEDLMPEKNASRWVAKDALLMFDSVLVK